MKWNIAWTLILSVFIVGCETSIPRPLHHWVFDEAHFHQTRFRPEEGNQSATLNGRFRLYQQGRYQAIALNGLRESIQVATEDEKIELPRRTLTVEVWAAIATPIAWGGLIGAFQDNGGYERGWILGYGEKHFYFALASQGADDGDGKLTYLNGKTEYRPNRWYHVVGTYDGRQMRLYVNGQLDAQSTEQSGDILYPPKFRFEIGAYHDANEFFSLNGLIRDVRVYARALSPEQIQAHFQRDALLTELEASYPWPPELVAGPYLQHVTQRSMTIMWETIIPSTSTVEYGETVPMKFTQEAPDRVTIHEVRLEGLKPATTYFYRVRSTAANGQETTSEVFTFQTAVPPDIPFAYVVIGDTRTYPDRFARIARLAYAERPNFVLHVGDVVSSGHVKEQWITEYLRPGAVLMQRVPTYIAIGNHEGNAHWFYDYSAYPPPENYYSFDYGNAHFAIVDTNQDITPGSKQYIWLKRDLASSTATWKFVAHHHPPYSSDENDYGNTSTGRSTLGDLRVRRALVPLYERYGVDIVWVGHIHDYERTWPIRGNRIDPERGVIYIQAGGGAAELENFAPTRSWFTAKLMRGWQYCLVLIQGKTLRMMAYDIDGKLFDFLELHK